MSIHDPINCPRCGSLMAGVFSDNEIIRYSCQNPECGLIKDVARAHAPLIKNGDRLSDTPTCDLVNELSKREGVQEVRVNPYDDLEQEMIAAKKRIPKEGPARILVVID